MADILIPELSESIKAGIVVAIRVAIGDKVTKGQTLLELETDKAVLEVPSPAEGVITEILVKKGDKIGVGQAAFRFSSDASAAPVSAQTPVAPAAVAAQTPAPTPVAAAKSAPAPVAAAPAPAASTNGADIAAAPSVRRFAREIGVNLSDVTGTDPHNRISIEDVKAHAKKLLTSRPTATGAGIPAQPLPDFSKWGQTTREPFSAIRKKTAEHMAYSWATVPHVTHFAKADITDLEKLRKQYSKDTLKLTVTPFLIKVIAAALKLHPKFNASIDTASGEIIYKKYYNIGCAVDTEHGLLVPVIRDADKKSILEIAAELQTLAEKARARKLTLDEMQGGTFTITNLGGITGGTFTPIVNAPEVAILGISRAEQEPCYNYGPTCMPRLMLPLCLSYDHRLIDGADGARFIKWVTDAMHQPLMLELK